MWRDGLGENSTFADYHPLVNLIYFALAIGICMFSMSPFFLAAGFVFSWCYCILLKGIKAVKFNIIISLIMILTMVVINMFFNNNGATVLFYINTNRITVESIYYGLCSAIMLVTIIIWFSGFNVIMSAEKLIYIFGKAAPVLGLTLSMIFRFIPLLRSRFEEISLGQKCMGRSHAEGSIIERCRQLLKEVSILIAWSLEASIESADSMEARGYGLRGRTSFHLYKLARRDKAALAILIAMGIPLVAAVAKGLTNIAFYPVIQNPVPGHAGVIVLILYICMLMTPIVIDIAGEYKWKQYNLKM